MASFVIFEGWKAKQRGRAWRTQEEEAIKMTIYVYRTESKNWFYFLRLESNIRLLLD